jgi:hypothetical protein
MRVVLAIRQPGSDLLTPRDHAKAKQIRVDGAGDVRGRRCRLLNGIPPVSGAEAKKPEVDGPAAFSNDEDEVDDLFVSYYA